MIFRWHLLDVSWQRTLVATFLWCIAADVAAADDVAATVGVSRVLVSDVQASLSTALGKRTVDEQTLNALKAEALERLIERELAEQALAAAKISVTDKELDAAMAQFKRDLARRDATLEGHLAQKRVTPEQFRRQLRWRLLWYKFLQSQLTEERLEAYFEKHRRRFDGTELRASHILLKPNTVGNPAEIETLQQRLTAIKAEIAAGMITFDAAAKKHSIAPSAEAGGDVGFFPYRGVMADAFADAAFRLQVGQISQPVISPFGVHLIQVTETKPGKKPFQQAREKVRNDAATALYQSLVARQRKVTKVAFTGASPYYETKDGKPGSRRLVEAETSTAKPTIKGASP